MPLFEYHCHRCDHTFEELVRRSALAVAMRCPKCERPDQVEKKLGTFSVGSATREASPPPFCGRCGENRPPCST